MGDYSKAKTGKDRDACQHGKFLDQNQSESPEFLVIRQLPLQTRRGEKGVSCRPRFRWPQDLSKRPTSPAVSSQQIAFIDHRLHFYDRHALVWLLLALERSAASPDWPGLEPFIPFLLATAAEDRDHVLVRQSTRKALLSLHAAGLVALDPSALRTLEAANRPVGLRPERSPAASGPARSDAHLRFFFDFDKYWCYGLAEAFGLSVPDVTRMASDVADAEWDFSSSARVEEDERRNRGLYRDDSTWAHGSEWPKEDDLGRYLGFHALMTVAGRLLLLDMLQASLEKSISSAWRPTFRSSSATCCCSPRRCLLPVKALTP